jgi:starch phosphorylase
VHIPTWIGGPMRALLDRHLGAGWLHRAADPATWAPVDAIPAAELWAVRGEQRATLVDFVRERSVRDRLGRDEPPDYVGAAARAFSPDVLTLGFARRLATYKRLYLLFQDAERGVGLLAGDRPVQIVLAGKAHPRDDAGKHQVQALFGHKHAAHNVGRVVYLDDYDLDMAATLVRGCDVWVNLPRPPLEASGTSGMKNVVNGGLHLSVLDGWWAEGHDGTNGWALPGEVDTDHAAQDWRDGQELYRLLEEEVVPSFYEHDADGLPAAWIARVRASLRTLGPQFAATRMVRDYVDQLYATQSLS